MPGDWRGRLGPSFEFVFHFNRAWRKVNKTVPTKPTKSRKNGHTFRKRDGSLRPTNSPFGQPFKIPDNVIRVSRSTFRGIERDHPATFPVGLPSQIVAAYTAEGESVLDSFMGSGTTGIACVQLGRAFTGIELHEPYFDIACRRIEKALRERSTHTDINIPLCAGAAA